MRASSRSPTVKPDERSSSRVPVSGPSAGAGLVARKPGSCQSPARLSGGGARLAASLVTRTAVKERTKGSERWAACVGGCGGTPGFPIGSRWPEEKEEDGSPHSC